MIKVSTGVEGLDEMLDGGFLKGRVILLCGGPGTGKTIFSLQFLASAAERGKPGVYVTLEEPINIIKENVETFGWNLKGKETNNRLRLLDFSSVPYGDASELKHKHDEAPIFSVISEVVNAVKAINAEHVVIDPLTSITIQEQRAGLKRRRIAELFGKLRSIGCTSILTSEMTSTDGEFYMEEFLADGVIRLDKIIQDFNLVKIIRVEKLRGIAYDEQPRRYTITSRGFQVLHTEPIMV